MTTTKSMTTSQPVNRHRFGPGIKQFARSVSHLVGCLAVAVVVPLLMRAYAGNAELADPALQFAVAASCAAIAAAHIAYCQVTIISEAQAIKHCLISLTSAFAIALIFLSISGTEFDRSLMALSLALSVGWHFGFLLLAGHIQPLRFSLIPAGDTQRLLTIRGTEWELLDTPDRATTRCTGLVTDRQSNATAQWEKFCKATALAGTPVFDSRVVREALTGRTEIDRLTENQFGTLLPSPCRIAAKLAIDVFAAFIAFIILAPVLIIISIAVRLDSPGPVFCRQRCMGYRGSAFALFKFRTTIDRTTNAQKRDDPMTRVGKFLHHHGLDLLPQIVNILRLEMSWVGPGPEVVQQFEQHQSSSPLYHQRLGVRPGFLSWSGNNHDHVMDNDVPLGKLGYDLYFIKNFSLCLDALTVLRFTYKAARTNSDNR